MVGSCEYGDEPKCLIKFKEYLWPAEKLVAFYKTLLNITSQ
jgi:hypothetical protein